MFPSFIYVIACSCNLLIFTAVKSHKYPIIDLPILLMEKEMATHSSILAWENPWTEEPGRYSPWSHKKVWHDFATKQHSIDDHLLFCFVKYEQRYEHSSASLVAQTVKKICLQCRCGFNPLFGKIPWKRAWQPTSVFLPGESPWTEEPVGLQSMGSQRVGHDWVTKYSTWTFLYIYPSALIHKSLWGMYLRAWNLWLIKYVYFQLY